MRFFTEAGHIGKEIEFANALVLCDENTFVHCYPKLGVDLPVTVIPAGEQHKKLEYCEHVWDKLLQRGANRQTVLFCLGGGMITDLGAFAAATFMRGISFIHIPSTLLGMVDACIGGKCGVDYKHYKNYLGLYAEPLDRWYCSQFLETLERSEIENGLAEMLKHGLIADKAHYYEVRSQLKEKTEISANLIEHSVSIKMEHVRQDYKEEGIRKRLNFGHTIGHALESWALSKQKPIPHGRAVAIGMIAEAYISQAMGFLKSEELEQIEEDLSHYFGIDLSYQPEELLAFVKKDKKNRSGQNLLCLLRGIGNAQEDLPINDQLILESLSYIKQHDQNQPS